MNDNAGTTTPRLFSLTSPSFSSPSQVDALELRPTRELMMLLADPSLPLRDARPPPTPVFLEPAGKPGAGGGGSPRAHTGDGGVGVRVSHSVRDLDEKQRRVPFSVLPSVFAGSRPTR